MNRRLERPQPRGRAGGVRPIISLPEVNSTGRKLLDSGQQVEFQQRGLARQEPLQERRGDVAFWEVGVVEDAAVERNRGLDAFDDEFVEGCSRVP